MGFGTLLGGYFLLLNFSSYYRYTDVIAALIMLYALYKLSGVNQMFKSASGAAALFSLFGFGELVLEMMDLFQMFTITETLTSVLAMIRCLLIGTLTVFMLLGIKSVSNEVGLKVLEVKSNYLSYVTVFIYPLNILSQTAELAQFLSEKALAYISVAILIATLALIIMNLTVIFSCYQKICMPEDNKADFTEKKSRFGFVNKFKAHEDARRREYAEYKMEKYKKKANNRKNGKK